MLNHLAQVQETINLAPPGGTGFANLGNLTFGNTFSAILIILLIVAAVAFFVMLVFGGIQWILSGGDKAKTESARGHITAAIIGLVVVFAAWAIVNLMQSFFGVSILSFNIPNAQTGGGAGGQAPPTPTP